MINVPGQGSLDLDTFLCKQPVSVVVYDFTAANASAAHKARCVCVCSCVRWVYTPLMNPFGVLVDFIIVQREYRVTVEMTHTLS